MKTQIFKRRYNSVRVETVLYIIQCEELVLKYAMKPLRCSLAFFKPLPQETAVVNYINKYQTTSI